MGITVTHFKFCTPYDGTLWTFALMKIKKIHDAWKDLEKNAENELNLSLLS
jgi:hypothetical protein